MKYLLTFIVYLFNLIHHVLSESGYISSVSNSLDKDNYRRISSLAGGTLIYIKGVGFSEHMGGNVV